MTQEPVSEDAVTTRAMRISALAGDASAVYFAAIDEIRAALASGSAWRDIATAPKDGTVVLACGFAKEPVSEAMVLVPRALLDSLTQTRPHRFGCACALCEDMDRLKAALATPHPNPESPEG